MTRGRSDAGPRHPHGGRCTGRPPLLALGAARVASRRPAPAATAALAREAMAQPPGEGLARRGAPPRGPAARPAPRARPGARARGGRPATCGARGSSGTGSPAGGILASGIALAAFAGSRCPQCPGGAGHPRGRAGAEPVDGSTGPVPRGLGGRNPRGGRGPSRWTADAARQREGRVALRGSGAHGRVARLRARAPVRPARRTSRRVRWPRTSTCSPRSR
jgi:hypothetical protein